MGHAETGRVWQSREFWRQADALLDGFGDLLRMFDDFQTAKHAATAEAPDGTLPSEEPRKLLQRPRASGERRDHSVGALVTWPDGAETLVTPPGCQDQPEAWPVGDLLAGGHPS